MAEQLALLVAEQLALLVAEQLALLTLDHKLLCLNPAVGRVHCMTVQCFIALSFTLSPLHHLDITEILLKEL